MRQIVADANQIPEVSISKLLPYLWRAWDSIFQQHCFVFMEKEYVNHTIGEACVSENI